ncbi:MAG: DUF5765 domain-containing protein [Holosporales bacterium]|jgi:hypothetical protein
MCWSGEASAVLAAVGLGSTLWAATKGRAPAALWMPLGYFSLMELLQAFTYQYIDQCGVPENQVATLLGWLHIAFQPFFINLLSLHFIRQDIAKKVAPWTYGACFAAAMIMIIHVYPFPGAGHCEVGKYFCGDVLCSVHGNWHIAWNIPFNGWYDNAYTGFSKPVYAPYFLVAFLLPLVYGSWRMTAYQLMVGPVLATMLTSNTNEMPAVWCLLSIGILLIVVKTGFRKFLYVRTWPLWPK